MAKQQQQMTAIIYDKKGRILSIGKNSYIKTHPMQDKYNKMAGKGYSAYGYAYLHCEIDAINRCKDLEKAYKIRVTRVKRDGSYGMACPCKACAIAISHTPIKVIEHT